MPINPPSNIILPPPVSGQPIMPSSVGPKRSSVRVILMIIILLVILGGAAYFFLVYSKDDAGQNLNDAVAVENSNEEVITNMSNSNTNTVNNMNITNRANTNNVSNINISNDNVNYELGSTFELGDVNPELITDEDGDSLEIFEEGMYGTSDKLEDTDGDGFSDYDEVNNCYNPTGTGRMDGEYFANTLCPGIWVWIMDQESYSLIKQHINGLCKDWESFADLYSKIVIAGELELYFDSGFSNTSAYIESCEYTTERLETTNLLQDFESIEEGFEADELCVNMSEIIESTLCQVISN